MTSRQERRAAKKAIKAARKLLPDFEPTLRHVAAADQAHAAYERAHDQGEKRGHEYEGLVGILKARGAPRDVLADVQWLVDMARRFDVKVGPAVAVASEMAPAMGLDVNGMTEHYAGIRRQIAQGLLHAASWKPEETGRALIEHLEHKITPDSWDITLALSTTDTYGAWQWGGAQ